MAVWRMRSLAVAVCSKMRRFRSFHRCQRIVAANAPCLLAFGRCLSCSIRWSHHRQNSEKLPTPMKECKSDWDQTSIANGHEERQCITDSTCSSHLGQVSIIEKILLFNLCLTGRPL
ncbi:hypothetical protein PIB30_006605 [Stylosanthes scabra]|uniref:Secreted protein n=1 Tax=Stylosanthes scabra TaxID=79078 RepID=A0ABU6Z401_9FABA|nr:hypothetical protein [Stylosanthes scabra]